MSLRAELETKRAEQLRRIDTLKAERDTAKQAVRRIRDQWTNRGFSAAEYRELPNHRAAADRVDAITAEIDEVKADLAGLNEHIEDVQSDDARRGDDNPVLQRVRGEAPATPLDGAGPVNARRANMVAPLAFEQEQLEELHRAAMSRQSRRVEARAFSSVDTLLPNQLWPEVIGPVHDNRVLSRLPVFPTELPVVQYIRHVSTTGAPTIVAEGAVKPELVLVGDRVLATAQKIAAHAAVSQEIIQDWSTWFDYVQNEVMQQVIDKENDELLNGNGTTGHLTGLLNTSGILTHTVGGTGTTPNGETALDAIEVSIAKLRVGAAKATADLLILHPATWSAIRRTKDGQQRYLTQPDPTVGETNTAWGVPVLVTTQIAAGAGALLDTTKFGRVHVREALNLQVGLTQDDFIRNLVRVIAEERLTLAVERPAAILAISGLPAS
ncbi:phage major capsid protein [Mycobacterium sp. PSTR-4-N]|uniref:phage major capsid protein n=1 Tax=Mycobacterium sp. PSTR-4-N TaxID=2917745 RepID=UPI001F14C45F|nr:phage major capsid protein [Mycobacterium sp. PSTR-4-N]MCG7595757.1 phage major capsid protein [Mycobacterium sp. PSTR-4-N]